MDGTLTFFAIEAWRGVLGDATYIIINTLDYPESYTLVRVSPNQATFDCVDLDTAISTAQNDVLAQ